jgi:hypothetical protein
MRILVLVLGLIFCVCGCGENVCEKALDVQRDLCKEYEGCIQCGCVSQGYFCSIDYDKLTYRQVGPVRIPDFTGPGVYCEKPSNCDGIRKEYAESCLEVGDEDNCAPWIYNSDLGIILCYDFGFETVYCEY